MNDVIAGFDLPQIPEVYPPISRDYVKYNQQSDLESVTASGDIFDVNKHRPRLWFVNTFIKKIIFIQP